MSPFRCAQSPTRPECVIHGLERLTAGTDEHYERLLWLTQSQEGSSEPPPDWFFRHLQTRLALLELYQDYFPCQWDKSDADTRLLNLGVHTPRELEFFDLLDQHRFPCEIENEDFQDGYCVYPLVPEWSEIEWEEIDCLVQCYAGLTGYADWQSVLDQYKLQDSGIDTPAPLEKVTVARLKTLCLTVESPLKGLNKAFEIIEHSTDNLWFDSHYMEPETFEWSRASIDRLTEAYKEAKDWLQEFNNLNDWLYTKPERIGSLVALWNAAQFDPDAIQLEIPFTTTINSEQWASGQYMRELQETRRHYQQLAYG